jgi:hypothetical protein
MSQLTTEDHQRLSTQLEDLQITLGYLRQCSRDILERVDVVSAQMKMISEDLAGPCGHQAPSEE